MVVIPTAARTASATTGGSTPRCSCSRTKGLPSFSQLPRLGGYGLTYQEAGYRHWGDRIIEDIIDATRFATGGHRRPGTDLHLWRKLRRLFGDAGAIVAPDLFRCAVGYSGSTTWPSGERATLLEPAWPRLCGPPWLGTTRRSQGPRRSGTSTSSRASPAHHRQAGRPRALRARRTAARCAQARGSEPDWLVESGKLTVSRRGRPRTDVCAD